MDFGEAKTILRKISKELKAFKRLDELIDFAVEVEAGLEEKIRSVTEMTNEMTWKLADMDREKAYIQSEIALGRSELEKLHEDYRALESDLVAAHNKKVSALQTGFKELHNDYSEKLAGLKKAIDEKTKRLKGLEKGIAEAKKDLLAGQEAYLRFKESI